MKFQRLKGDSAEDYEVTIVGGGFPENIREKIIDHNTQRITGEIFVESDVAPKKYDIIIDDGECLVVVWTNADKMRGAYHVHYAAWPYEWKQWIPR